MSSVFLSLTVARIIAIAINTKATLELNGIKVSPMIVWNRYLCGVPAIVTDSLFTLHLL